MTRFIPTVAVAAALTLGGCNASTSPTVQPNSIASLLPSAVQDAVTKACGLIPTIQTVNDLIIANPTITIASTFAKDICKAAGVARRLHSPLRAHGPIVVRGVTITFEAPKQ